MSDEIGTPPPVQEGPRSFTQQEVNALMADERRKIAARYADYDDLKAARIKLDEVELTREREQTSAKSATEAAEKRAAEAEAARKSAESTVLRYQIAAEGNLTPAQAKWLSGDSEDEIRKSLKAMRETFGLGHTITTPKAQLMPGGGNPSTEPVDMNSWLRGVASK